MKGRDGKEKVKGRKNRRKGKKKWVSDRENEAVTKRNIMKSAEIEREREREQTDS